MRRKKLQLSASLVPKTAEQIAFETQWNAEPKVKNDESKKPASLEPTPFDPTPSSSQLLPPESSALAVSAAAILFGKQSNSRGADSFAKDDDLGEFTSFDDNEDSRHAFEDRKNLPIPGLEFAPLEFPPIEETEDPSVIDLDREEECEFPQEFEEREMEPLEEPRNFRLETGGGELDSNSVSRNFPRFRPRIQRNVIDIDDLLIEPRRSVRPAK
jgi:hypothetical protein